MDPMFSPPLHRQRHQFVVDFVKRNKPKKVGEVLLRKQFYLKHLSFVASVCLNDEKLT